MLFIIKFSVTKMTHIALKDKDDAVVPAFGNWNRIDIRSPVT